jgi:hypothetical protein
MAGSCVANIVSVNRRFYPQHLRRRRRRLGLIVFSLFLFGSSAGAVFSYRWYKSRPVWKTYADDSLGVSVDYPSTFKDIPIVDAQRIEAGYLLRAKRVDPDALLSLRYEDDLGPLKALKGSIFLSLVDAVNRRYPERFPEYKKEGYEETVVANEKAARFDFTYLGSDDRTRVRQRLFIVVRGDTAFYLVFQAPESEFQRSKKDFDKIISSFAFL